MLHFIFDFILKSQPSHPSPLVPFTKTTGPEGLCSLKAMKASPRRLTPSLFIYTQPRSSVHSWNGISNSGHWELEMQLWTLGTGGATLPQAKKQKSRVQRWLCSFSRRTPAGFHHSGGIHPYRSSTLKENRAGVFNRDCQFPDSNLITVHTCNLFLLRYIIIWL